MDEVNFQQNVKTAVLRNRFRLRLLKGYGSGSDFWKVTVPVTVPAQYSDHKKYRSFQQFVKNLDFLM